MKRIDYKATEHITKDVLKCNNCGCERLENPSIEYEYQSECPECGEGQMMGWEWNGWKPHKAREMSWEIRSMQVKINELLKVSQKSDRLSRFTRQERTIGPGVYIEELGQVLPWMGALGAASIKVWGIRQRGNVVEYGVGNKEPPILAWVTADSFPKQWSK